MDKELSQLIDKYKAEGLTNLGDLSFLFKMRGEPCNLDDHYMFRPSFNTTLPKRSMHKVARQLGKTTNDIAIPKTLRCILIPNWTTLVVAPLFEQAKRISNIFVNPLIKSSPFKGCFIDSVTQANVLCKSFANGSIMHFSYAYLDAERVRGIPGVDEWHIDEAQAMNWDFIPIIRETASASPFGFEGFDGTPLTFDNTLERLWQEGTQSELCFKCPGCNKWNVPAVDEHLLQMIGKKGPVCYNCGNSIQVYDGKWVARFPEKAEEMVSRHMPQITHPIHSKEQGKWNDILYKVRKYPQGLLYNEVFGESFDTADRIFTLSDLIKASKGVKNELQTAMKRMSELKVPGIAVDWSGGGAATESYTALAAGGLIPGTDQVEIPFIIKIPKNYSVEQEMNIILDLKNKLRAKFMAHDYGGVGRGLESLLFQMGMPVKEIISFNYVMAPKKEIVYPDVINEGHRYCWNLDKMRSLVVLSVMMKAGKVVLPDWRSMEALEREAQNKNSADAGRGNPARDFLNLCSEQLPSKTGSDVFRITKTPGSSDDAADAVNLLCTAIWNSQGRYPNVKEAMHYQMTAEQIAQVCPDTPDWN